MNNEDLVINEELETALVKHNYKTSWISKIDNAVVTEFPFRTQFSILWSVLTVYPKLEKFIKVKSTCKINAVFF